MSRLQDSNRNKVQKKKPGGQPGNKNAAGHGAPVGNINAETHGAFSHVTLDSLTLDERAYIEGLTLDTEANMLRELQLLLVKERDITRKIKEYEEADPSTLYVDRVVEMIAQKSKKDMASGKRVGKEDLKPSMQTVIKASSFDRAMKLESEYNKLHGRILKLIDTIRAYEIDKFRLLLDERKHTLTKQRLTGEYNIDLDIWELIDTDSAEDTEDSDIE